MAAGVTATFRDKPVPAVITEALAVADSSLQRGLDARVPKVVAFPEQRLA
jgi:hypothetical protein